MKVNQYRIALKRERTLQVSDVQVGNFDAATRVVLGWYRATRPVGECVIVLGLSGANEVLGIAEIGRGGLHAAALVSADVIRAAIAMGASAIILAHNHPSERVEPSPDDRRMTADVKAACKVCGITLCDHIVVAVRSGQSRSVED